MYKITASEALPGRHTAICIANIHFVTTHVIVSPFPAHIREAMFGLGCFWGAEKKFWQQAGVFSTAVGYSGGYTPNPTYDEVCTGLTGHNEVVKVFFDPKRVSYQQLLVLFWESHNPTQGMQQGNDKGTQYRSGIYTFSDEQQHDALHSKAHYQTQINASVVAQITTEIKQATTFYYGENDHQQYLAKNPQGYCGLGGLGIAF